MPVVHRFSIFRSVASTSCPSRIGARRLAILSIALVALAPAAAEHATTAVPANPLLDRIWSGVKAAETLSNACGTLIETRLSRLAEKPLRLQGTFCAAGRDRFRLDYASPHPIRIIYNDGTLNVSTDGGKHTEAMYVLDSVERGQEYFSGPRARQNLERDFSVSATESADRYRLLLTPVSGRIGKRVTRILVELSKRDFLPRRIEIDGKNGIKGTYEIEIERVNVPLDRSIFHAYNPKPRRETSHRHD